MSLSLYEASVPVYVRMLTCLSGVLDKAAAWATAKKVDPAVLIGARLYPDMWSVAEQVRAAANFPIRSIARLAGLPIPQFDGKDDSVEALKARIAFAVKFVAGVDRGKIDGSEAKPVTFPTGDTQHTLSGQDYLLKFAMPNFYFHATTAYDILRHNGVPLVKEDYMGEV